MTPAKRARTGSETDQTPVTPLLSSNHASTGQLNVSQAPTLLPPGPIHTPQITLQNIPAEVFLFITDHLSIRDIISLSQCTRDFEQILAPTARFNMARLGKAYDETTQTLDLTQAFPLLQQLQAYQHYLQQITETLKCYSRWTKTHIKTLVLPLKALYQWELHKELSALLPHLTGVNHLSLSLSIPQAQGYSVSFAGSIIRGFAGAFQKKLWDNLATFNVIPAKKLTLNNILAVKHLYKPVCHAINEQLLNPALEELVFTDEQKWIPALFQFPLVNSHLTTLDFSSSSWSVISLDALPDTIHCLRINSETGILDHTTQVKRLEILAGKEFDSPDVLSLQAMSRTSPQYLSALKEIYIDLPPHPEQHRRVLEALAQLPRKGLSVTFSNLHIHNPAVLDRAMLKNTIYLPQDMTFHFSTREDIRNFEQIARQGAL